MRSVCLTLVLLMLAGLTGCDDPPTDPPAPPPAPQAIAEPTTEPTTEPSVEATGRTGGEAATAERAPALTVAQARQVRGHLTRARRANREGDTDVALEQYRAAAAIDPDGRALCEMGWVLFQSDQRDAARDALTRGLAHLPTHDPVPEAFVGPVGACFYNAGRLEEDAGNTALARRHYSRSLAVRPGNRVVQARLDALPSQDSVAVVGALPRCTEGSRATDLGVWAARVRALEGPRPAWVAPLLEVGLNVPEAWTFVDIEGRGDGEASALTGTVAQIPLTFGERRGVAVHVSLDDRMGGRFDGLAVLRANGASDYCVLGTIEKAVDACSTSCASDDPVFEVATESLVASNRDALRVITRAGACTCGSYRGAHHELAYYGAEGDSLATYLEAVTYDGWYQSPWTPTDESTSEVTLGTGFPRTLTIVSREECEPCGESLRAQMLAAADDADEERASLQEELFDQCGEGVENECRPGEERSTLVYRGGHYVEGP